MKWGLGDSSKRAQEDSLGDKKKFCILIAMVVIGESLVLFACFICLDEIPT